MKIQQIRNATVRIAFGGKTFLIDPWLAGKGETGCIADIPGHPYTIPDPVKEMIPMPIFPLPFDRNTILAGVDAYIVTHLHPDHVDMNLDGTVGAPLDHTVPVFVQNEADRQVFVKSGFTEVTVLKASGTSFGDVKLTKTPARHGTINPCGEACGVIFEADDEKTLYLAGDTVWYKSVGETLRTFKPAVTLINACAAETVQNGRLIMNDEDIEAVSRTLPGTRIFLTHMDNVPHASITRTQMRGLLARRGITDYVMPADGKTETF